MDKEYVIVTAEGYHGDTIFTLFSSREAAMAWWTRLTKLHVPVSMSAVELDNHKELIQEFGLDDK